MSKNNISLLVSLNKIDKTVDIDKTQTVKSLREQIAKSFKEDAELLTIVFNKNILEDSQVIGKCIDLKISNKISCTKDGKKDLKKIGNSLKKENNNNKSFNNNNSTDISAENTLNVRGLVGNIKLENYQNKQDLINTAESYLNGKGFIKNKDYFEIIHHHFIKIIISTADSAHDFYLYCNSLPSINPLFRGLKATLFFDFKNKDKTIDKSNQSRKMNYNYPENAKNNINNSYNYDKELEKRKKIENMKMLPELRNQAGLSSSYLKVKNEYKDKKIIFYKKKRNMYEDDDEEEETKIPDKVDVASKSDKVKKNIVPVKVTARYLLKPEKGKGKKKKEGSNNSTYSNTSQQEIPINNVKFDQQSITKNQKNTNTNNLSNTNNLTRNDKKKNTEKISVNPTNSTNAFTKPGSDYNKFNKSNILTNPSVNNLSRPRSDLGNSDFNESLNNSKLTQNSFLKKNLISSLKLPSAIGLAKRKEIIYNEQQNIINHINPKLNRISTPYLSEDERRNLEYLQIKERWVDKKGFKLVPGKKLPEIKNYVGATPNKPVCLHDFRSNSKDKWIDKKGFRVA